MFTHFLSFLVAGYIFAWHYGLIKDPETEPEWKQLNRVRKYMQSKEFKRKHEKYINSLEKKFRKEVKNMSAEEKMLKTIDEELLSSSSLTAEEMAEEMAKYQEDLDQYYAENPVETSRFAGLTE